MRTIVLGCIASVSVVVSCGDEDHSKRDRVGVVQDPMSYEFWLNDPVSSPITTNPFGTGNPAGTGVATSIGVPTDPNNCRECTYTVNPNSATSHITSATTLSGYANTSLWNHGGTNSLRTKVNGAQSQATAVLTTANYASPLSATLTDFRQKMITWGVNPALIAPPSVSVTSWFRAFTPTQSRELVVDNGTLYHPSPYAFEELRYRGLRNHCAMREGARQQMATAKYTMESKAGSSFIEWTLGAASSTVGIGPSWKDTSSPVANVFVIPIALGSKIAPIHGPLFPTVGQIVHPVAWVTGDSIIISNEGTKTYANSQHADAFLGQRLSGSLSASNIPIAQYGFISLTAGFSFNAEFGTLIAPAGTTSPFTTDLSAGRGYRYSGNDFYRSYLFDKLVSSNPVTYRPSPVAGDAPFTPDPPFRLYENDGPYSPQIVPGPGGNVRIKAVDDRALSVGDQIRETLSLSYGGGWSGQVGPFSLAIGIGGTTLIDLTIQRVTTFRDHMSAVKGTLLLPTSPNAPPSPPPSGFSDLTPQSNVLVTPEMKQTVVLNPLAIGASYHLIADFFGWHVDEADSKNVYSIDPISLGPQTKQIGAEPSRLRVGSFTDLGGGGYGYEYDTSPTINSRSTYSHLPDPNAADTAIPRFASFPDSGIDSVRACLVDSSTTTLPNPEGGLIPLQPSMQLCTYGPTCLESQVSGGRCAVDAWHVPTNVCTTGKAAFLATFAPPYQSCLTNVINFLCDLSLTPDPKVQPWIGLQNVIVRPANQSVMDTIQSQCLSDILATATTQAQANAAAEYVLSLFHPAFCDSSWNILGKSQY
jgi:hypothetical protein